MMKFSSDSVRTGGVGDPEIVDLDRRAQDNIRFAHVEEADYESSPPLYRFGFGDKSDEDNYILTDWLPAGGGRAKGDTDTHLFEVGEKVVLLSEGGELSTAQAIPGGTYTSGQEDETERAGANKPGVYRKRFKNGAEISYDRNSGAMLFDATDGGTCIIRAGGCEIELSGGNITVRARGDIALKASKIMENP